MDKKEIYSYVYDFVSRLIERLPEGSVRSIIVFGSVVRGDFDKESDVDIFIDAKNEKLVEEKVRKSLNEFYSHSRHTWVVRGIDNQINPIVGDLSSVKRANLKNEIISNSILIYGQYAELPENISDFVLINYDISKLKPKDKSKFVRDLLGYRLLRNKKEYKVKGILDEVEGKRLVKNAILVPKRNQQQIYKFFSMSKASVERRAIWIKG